jgi:tetratricopeptide (TPR) repeat protein
MKLVSFKILGLGLWGILIAASSIYADPREDYFKEGQQAYEQGDYNKAANLFEKVVELDPNYAPVYNALGLTYRGLNGSLDDISWLFKVATDIDPNYIEAYENACKTFYQAAQYDDAEKNCMKILSINPHYGPAQMTLGWIYLGKSEPQKAVRYFEEIIKKVQAPGIYFGLGMAYARSGQQGEALDTITKLRSLGQDQLAAQLENMVRTKEPPRAPSMAPMAPALEMPEREPGTIVSSSGKSQYEEPQASAPPAPGGMKIRLKAKLTMTPKQPSAGSAPAAPSAGSSSTYGTNDNRSAIERIRALQKKRLGAIPQSGSGY